MSATKITSSVFLTSTRMQEDIGHTHVPPPPCPWVWVEGLIHLWVLDRDPGCLLGPPAHMLPGHCSGLYRPTLLSTTCGKSELTLLGYESLAPLPPATASASSVPAWQDRTIASSRLRLLEYSAFMEVQRDPDTVMWGRWGVWHDPASSSGS